MDGRTAAFAAIGLAALSAGCDAFALTKGSIIARHSGLGLESVVTGRCRADGPLSTRMLQTKICEDSEIQEGGRKVVKAGGVTVVVAKHEGKTYAFNNKCPHLGLSLKRGKITPSTDRNGVCITCPYHNSQFSLEENGKCKVWSERVLGIKGTEAIGEAIGGFVAPMAKSVNPLRKKAAPAVVYSTSVEDGQIVVDLPPDLSGYAKGGRIFKGYMQYDEIPREEVEAKKE